jgi:hypothetical protein
MSSLSLLSLSPFFGTTGHGASLRFMALKLSENATVILGQKGFFDLVSFSDKISPRKILVKVLLLNF